MIKFHVSGLMLLAFASTLAWGQSDPPPPTYYHPGQEVRVSGLPSLTARSKDAPDVLLTAVETIFHDQSVCCGKDSALEDRLPQSQPTTVQEIAAKVQGRQLLSDGRPIRIKTEMLSGSSTEIVYRIILALKEQHALLLQWNSRFYILYGAIYDERVDSSGDTSYTINRLLLLDMRYADARREASFNRETDDWNQVQGVLLLAAVPQ